MSIAALKILPYSVLVSLKLDMPMSTNTSDVEILTIKQIAEFLRVTDRTIYRLAAAKKIPAFKVGGTWRFSRADIDSWIKQQSMEVLALGQDNRDSANGQMNNEEQK